MRRLPFEKTRLVDEAMVRGQRSGSIHAEIDLVLMVFSVIGLVMLHMTMRKFFAETFHREVPDRDAICRRITAYCCTVWRSGQPRRTRKFAGRSEGGGGFGA